MPKGLRQKLLFRLLNYWPPYFGAGVRVSNLDMEKISVDVEMKLRFWNKNYVGTHFGGSLYAMCDPFFMLLVMEKLGPEYIVWDKSAEIQFKKPGRGTVRAHFHVEKEVVQEIRERLKTERKIEPVFEVQVRDEAGEVIAEIKKKIYIRRKDSAPKQLPV
jgi:acyl-coenzyme A thioesterase PaaI-like protein